ATYTLPLKDSLGPISISTSFNYIDSYYVQTKATGRVGSVALLNLNMSWESIAGSPVDLSLFATNVTDTHYSTFVQDQGTGFISRALGDPQFFGARVKYHFGADAK